MDAPNTAQDPYEQVWSSIQQSIQLHQVHHAVSLCRFLLNENNTPPLWRGGSHLMIASLDFDGASDDDEKLVHARMAVDLLRGCVANREEVNLHSVEGHLLELAMEKVASLEASGEDDDDEAMDEGGSENGSEEEDENEDEDDDKDVNMRNDEPQERAGDRIMYMGPYLTVIGAGNEEAWDEEDNEDNEDSALLEDEEEQAHEEEAQDYEPAEAPRFIFKPASQLREEDLLPEMSEEEKAARVQAVQRFSVAVKEMEGEKQ